jgi:hypothetical protein
MIDLKIVCPSMGRAKDIRTIEVINDLIIVCPKNELSEYKENYPNNEIIPQPTDVKGITATRQFILDTFDNVFMIDDDVAQVKKMYHSDLDQAVIDDPQMVRDIIQRNAQMCKDLGAFMFGFTNWNLPVQYPSWRPLKFTGYMNASYCGFLKGHNLRYDTTLSEGEDHYMSLYNMYVNRYALIDFRYTFATKDNFRGSGGCCDYRTNDDMKETTLKLRRLFGDPIQLKKGTSNKKKVIEGERSIIVPY